MRPHPRVLSAITPFRCLQWRLSRERKLSLSPSISCKDLFLLSLLINCTSVPICVCWQYFYLGFRTKSVIFELLLFFRKGSFSQTFPLVFYCTSTCKNVVMRGHDHHCLEECPTSDLRDSSGSLWTRWSNSVAILLGRENAKWCS